MKSSVRIAPGVATNGCLRRRRVLGMVLLESVPNFSEGRDHATIAALGDALEGHVRVLDLHVDADHNRCVFTVVGDYEPLVAGLVAAVAVAIDRITLDGHVGVHPRIGAADVVPIVPIVPGDLVWAKALVPELGHRLGALGVPVFVYDPPQRGPAYYRRGGLPEVARRLASGDLASDFGPTTLHPTAGAVICGARTPLVAFNVNLRGTLADAKAIAAIVRESGGGFPGVRALGLALEGQGLVQVSMNIEDWQASPPYLVVERIATEAERLGAEVVASELIGLLPAGVVAQGGAEALRIPGFDDSRILEARIAASD
ncbi:MAG: glutamate formimidoyltransferase [Actinobacteria bacterium]|nr:glutamate formimidoyltransferase [Actinomycetota bacterium]